MKNAGHKIDDRGNGWDGNASAGSVTGTLTVITQQNGKSNTMKPEQMQSELARHGIETKLRTPKQNNSLHLWLRKLAKSLNESGQSLGDGKLIRVPVAYTEENLKEAVLKPYMNALYPEVKSTTELTTEQTQTLYQNLDLIIAERSGVHVEWPSEESLYYEAIYGKAG